MRQDIPRLRVERCQETPRDAKKAEECLSLMWEGVADCYNNDAYQRSNDNNSTD